MHDTDAAVITPEHRELLGELLDRWSLHIIDELCEGPRRFNDLRRAVPDVSPSRIARKRHLISSSTPSTASTASKTHRSWPGSSKRQRAAAKTEAATHSSTPTAETSSRRSSSPPPSIT
jgi:hypothetical protein